MTLLNYKYFKPEDPTFQTATPLIILHGLMGSMDNWRTQAKRLSQQHPIYTLDLRNHGHSPHIKGMSYREMYEDVLETANHLHLNHFHLLGHSMGGKVAMQLSLAHSDIIQSLIIVDIAPKPYPLWHQKTLQGVLSAPIDSMSTRKEVDTYLQDWIDNPSERTFMLKNLKRIDGQHHGFTWRCNMQEISRGYLKIAGFSTALQSYKGKCLFIKGEQSHYIHPSDDRAVIISLFPKAEIVSLNKSGHLPHIQQADLFFTKVNNFLSK